MSAAFGINVPGPALAYWPGNPLVLRVDWDVDDPTGGHTWKMDVYRGDTARPTSIRPATVAVVGQVITATWTAVQTLGFGPGAVWRLLRDDVTVLAGRMARDEPAGTADLPTSLTVNITGPPVLTVTGLLVGPAAGTEVDYAEITADTAGITVDSFNLDVVPGLAIDVPDLDVPVYITAQMALSHSVANAKVFGGIALTGGVTVLDGLASGPVVLGAIGSQNNSVVIVRRPPHSVGTYQAYVYGDAGTLTVKAQTYYPSKMWAVTA